ncbi:helix-turn-helix domain-containing protein [Streptomyces fuscichromogenes]|uniref:helix-turn-helix domain-containing protein n=1 Tax=Streptomyces fuscichromogenes TaxID=1324013 RepID=UPI001E521426|nr:LysR family transcriptional regulator [Streptomyces fuscichromogenes]
MTPGTVARWARHHHIPRQSNRHLSRPALGIEYIPAVLQPALNNNYQLRRLRTFFQIAGYRSLGDACAALGLSSHSVTNHLARLEEDMGGPLLVRTQRSRPMEPTALGHQVLDAARPLSDQLGVPTTAVPAKPIPPSRRGRPRTTAAAATRLAHLPALLRPAAGSYGGRLRLRRFLEAVQYPNLAAFARAEGLDPSTVTLQISRLERDFDGRLLDRGGPGHAMRLTGLGKRVVAAAQPYRDQLGDLHGPRHRPKPPQQLTDDLT